MQRLQECLATSVPKARDERGRCCTVVSVIRDYASSDLPAIWQINRENVPAVGEETPETLHEIVEVCSVALVVEINREVVGFCLVLPPGTTYDSPNYRYFCDRYENFVYLDRVAFTAPHRGRGLGAALYREVERRAAAEWFTLEVNVVPPNEGSMRFHLREGFVEMDRLETRPGKIVSLMVKGLASGKQVGVPGTVTRHD